MQADLIMAIAIITKLKLLTEKEAKELFEELRYTNLSMEFSECLTIVENAFNKVGVKNSKTPTVLNIDGKDISVTK